MIDFMFGQFPHLKEVPKMRKFLSQGGHLKLERADDANNTAWMKSCADKGFLQAMVAHREGCRGIIPLPNFDKWCDTFIGMYWAKVSDTDAHLLPMKDCVWEIGDDYYLYTEGKGIKLIPNWDLMDSKCMVVRFNR